MNLSTTLLCKQRREWQSKDNFLSSKVSDKGKKKYSPNFIAIVVFTHDGFQKFSRLKICPTSPSINRVTSLFIRQSWKSSEESSRENLEKVQKESEIVRNWEFKKIFSYNFPHSVCCIHQHESSLYCQSACTHQLSVIKVYFQ